MERNDRQIQSAIHRYLEEKLSLAKAAELAGVSWVQMRDILLEQGIQPALGPATLEEAQTEVDALRLYLLSQ
jgi:predicted HTH domain antitoxin